VCRPYGTRSFVLRRFPALTCSANLCRRFAAELAKTEDWVQIESSMTDQTYNVIKPAQGAPLKAWTKGIPLEDAARPTRDRPKPVAKFRVSSFGWVDQGSRSGFEKSG
jgi:hypothetical protein